MTIKIEGFLGTKTPRDQIKGKITFPSMVITIEKDVFTFDLKIPIKGMEETKQIIKQYANGNSSLIILSRIMAGDEQYAVQLVRAAKINDIKANSVTKLPRKSLR